MASIAISTFVVLLTSLLICNIVFSLSTYEDKELERQLKVLNKRPIKTIKTEDGNIFDCVVITKQPAFDHPLLKDHTIQTKPSSYSPKKEESSGDGESNGSLESLFEAIEECPVGTVPIQRTTKEHLVRARSLLDDTTTTSTFKPAVVALIWKPSFKVFGSGGRASIQNLAVSTDQYSSSNIWVQSGPSNVLNYISAGWMVSPGLYGDSRTRLYTFWTGDGRQNTGCYNTLCPGFVQVDRRITPTSLVTPPSKYGGTQYDIKIQVYQDRPTGNWWFVVSDGTSEVAVGYWPSRLFPYMSAGAEQVAWGGIAQPNKAGISPPMGNGFFPDGDYRHSGFFSNVHYVNGLNTMVSLTDQVVSVQNDKPLCYGIMNNKLLYLNLGYSFAFGGPGGNCG